MTTQKNLPIYILKGVNKDPWARHNIRNGTSLLEILVHAKTHTKVRLEDDTVLLFDKAGNVIEVFFLFGMEESFLNDGLPF